MLVLVFARLCYCLGRTLPPPSRRTTRDGRTDENSLEKHYFTLCFLIFNSPNPLDPFLKRLFNREFHINSKGNPLYHPGFGSDVQSPCGLD